MEPSDGLMVGSRSMLCIARSEMRSRVVRRREARGRFVWMLVKMCVVCRRGRSGCLYVDFQTYCAYTKFDPVSRAYRRIVSWAV